MPSVDLSGMRVLVVEDETMISMLLEDMLAELGCTAVGPVTSIEPALKLIENVEFDLAILDVNLNGDETYPIADVLAAREIPFLFASGYRAARLRDEYRGVPSLQKPFDQQELERTLAALMARSTPRIARRSGDL